MSPYLWFLGPSALCGCTRYEAFRAIGSGVGGRRLSAAFTMLRQVAPLEADRGRVPRSYALELRWFRSPPNGARCGKTFPVEWPVWKRSLVLARVIEFRSRFADGREADRADSAAPAAARIAWPDRRLWSGGGAGGY